MHKNYLITNSWDWTRCVLDVDVYLVGWCPPREVPPYMCNEAMRDYHTVTMVTPATTTTPLRNHLSFETGHLGSLDCAPPHKNDAGEHEDYFLCALWTGR
eukprot:scpid48057/ scgid13717/ 